MFPLIGYMNNAVMNICVQDFGRIYVFNSLECIPRSEFAGSYDISMFTFLRNYFSAIELAWHPLKINWP